jgi:response regulator RpfG family c-di-GMP phosphodiesterase
LWPAAEPLDTELELPATEFSAIHAANFVSGHKSFFDLYVRLPTGRYVKILKAGDAFEAERVRGYLERGVRSFFIRKEAQASYVAYCDHLASALVARPSAPVGIKASQTLNAGEETLHFLLEHGVARGTVDKAARYARNVHRLVAGHEAANHPAVRALLNDPIAYDHAVGATLVAGALLSALNFTLERVHVAVGMATLLHDVGLHAFAPGLDDREEWEMSVEELETFHRHPHEGTKILAGVRGIDSLVLHAVYHHHERRDGSGFPRRAPMGNATQLSEIVGLSDEFVRLLRRAARDPRVKPMHELHSRVFHGFSYPLMRALTDVLG